MISANLSQEVEMRDFLKVALLDPMHQLYSHLVMFVPKLLGMAVLVLIGLLLGWILAKMIRKSLVAVHFDKFCAQIGLTAVLQRGNISKPTSDLLASIIYWLVVLNFFMIGLRTLDETVMSQVFSKFFAYLPNLIVAIFIFVAGSMLSRFIGRSVLIGAVNSQLPSAKLLSIGVQVLIMIFVLSLALEQLGIGKATIVATFSILFGGVVLALAIAFGLGGREMARHFLERRLRQKDTKDKDEGGFLSHL
jgi:small-conductance mechanosensitive channel